jgi:hypothetical protein
MATARIKAPTDAMLPVKHGARYSAKLTSSGRASNKMEVKIPLKSKTLRILASESRSTKTLIEKYGVAVARSRMGKSVRFIVRLSPGHEPKFRLLEGESTQDVEPAGNEHDGDLESALAAARERGQVRIAEILKSDDMLTVEEFAHLIGTSRVTVNAKRQNHQVLGLEGARRGFRFPKWQIGEDGKPFAALPKLFDCLGGSSWAVYRFLVQHHPELDGLSGREALARGRAAEALEATESAARSASS